MRRQRSLLGVAALCLSLAACVDAPTEVPADTMPLMAKKTPGGAAGGSVVALGQALFTDERLSVNGNQSCQTCHHPLEGFTAPLATTLTRGSVVQGSVPGRFGARKPISAAYASLAPRFAASGNGATGGNFWDGRATGAVLGSPTADQALGPFLNPVEQALPDAACVVYLVRIGPYDALYRAVWGDSITTIGFPATTASICSTPVAAGGTAGEYVPLLPADRATVQREYHRIARSIMEFEASLNVFTSRFDAGQLTALEQQGLKLFGGKGKCQQCHTNKGARAPFTDFAYHNLGVPKNPAIPDFSAAGTYDRGLGGFTGVATHEGRFRTPTLRNVGSGINRTFMHNGALVSLKQVVDFYSTRDVLPTCTPAQLATLQPAEWGSYDPDGPGPLKAGRCWPPAEFRQNLDTKNMGKLGLSEAEVDAIVAFMRALTDR